MVSLSTVSNPESQADQEKDDLAAIGQEIKPAALTGELEKDTSKESPAIKPEPNKVESKRPEKRTPKWQDRLLPVMSGVLIGLTVFFFLATFIQMSYLHWNILQMPVIDIGNAPAEDLTTSAETFEDIFKARQLEIQSKLEAFVITNRYRQANVLLMAGLWIRYLGFITGMILALVGASFILGKLREPQQELRGEFSNIRVNLATTSPGLILVVLGVVLMFTTMVNRDTYSVTDAGVYLSETAPSSNLFEPLPTIIPPELFPPQPTTTK